MDRDFERRRHDEYQTGLLAAAIANWSMSAPKEPLRPRDFNLPLLRVGEKVARIRSRKKIAANVRAMFDRAMSRQPKKT